MTKKIVTIGINGGMKNEIACKIICTQLWNPLGCRDMMFEGATGDPTFIGRIYIGFNLSPMGSFLGLIWGFFDGAIGGLLFALLYNMLVKRCK